jgi:hypothetical protein
MTSTNAISTPIQPDTNNDNNTTRIMQVDTLYANIITDEIATIEDGFISNLIEPVNDNQIATKYYVDHNSGGGGAAGPNNSVQYNSAGIAAGSANLTISNPGQPSATLTINGTLTNGTITMAGSQISGLATPVNPQDAANKNYVDNSFNNLEVIAIQLEQATSYSFTPANVYNKIINLTMNNNYLDFCPLDTIPTAADMKTYLGSSFQVGKTWTTIFRAPQNSTRVFARFVTGNTGVVLLPFNYLYCGLTVAGFTLANYSVITMTSVVTNAGSGTEEYYSYVTNNLLNIVTNARITDRGVYTPSLGNGSLLNKGITIYPVLENPVINSAVQVTYTYSQLQKMLIVRTGLAAPVSDTFVTAATLAADSAFTMGGGTFKFWIQNPTAFDLTLVPSAGWSFHAGSNAVIPAQHCGAFWVTVVVSPASCLIYSIGTNPING